ncbi:DUF3322 domain-containing protein [Arthrobacter sp. TMN-49]
MSPAPVTQEAARAQALKKYQRHCGQWAAATPTPAPALALPLHPPTEAQALKQGRAAIDWVGSWNGIAGVIWSERQWASLGRQRVPGRLVLEGPIDVARFCGTLSHWRRISERAARLMEWAAATPRPAPPGTDFPAAVARSIVAVEALDDADFARLAGVLDWLRDHPESGLYVRQLPIRGVDSKWVGAHRGLVERLHSAATGAEGLGLAKAPGTIRVRFLDPTLAPGGLVDVGAPAASLAALELAPSTVFVFENLESVLAMPPMTGAVVVHGSGYAVDRLAAIPWIRAGRILYWGDLDSHGFAILNRFRSYGLAVTTVLMDVPTLDEYMDLCVPEPKPATGTFAHLLPEERHVMAELAARGNVRLEQERLEWAYALAVLEAARTRQGGPAQS